MAHVLYKELITHGAWGVQGNELHMTHGSYNKWVSYGPCIVQQFIKYEFPMVHGLYKGYVAHEQWVVQ
jgi:hypothetical protein